MNEATQVLGFWPLRVRWLGRQMIPTWDFNLVIGQNNMSSHSRNHICVANALERRVY